MLIKKILCDILWGLRLSNPLTGAAVSAVDHVVWGAQLTAGGGRGKKMEGNRDEAEKCINIATKALEAGDKEKAFKFLNKAEKLYPTIKAKGKAVCGWLVRLANQAKEQPAPHPLILCKC